MIKRLTLLLVVVVILGLGGFLYYRWHLNYQDSVDTLIYNTSNQKWEKYNYEDPIESDREAILDVMAGKDDINYLSITRG